MGDFAAIIGLITALVGLISTIIGRKKIIEQRIIFQNKSHRQHKNNRRISQGFQKKWYDNRLVIAVLIVLFFPVGFYALYMNRTISKIWKWIWFALFWILVLSA